ncbi:hypothetical protein M1R55_22495 (plasmid) [Deinococcus sp. QL22]|nr:hypothetical protein M1R55_22495 [Deinococcus sp. QL22]
MKIITCQQTHPPELATTEALADSSLQPAQGQAVVALFYLRSKDRERLTALYRRADAVLLEEKKQA